jgi:hypothetical protein
MYGYIAIAPAIDQNEDQATISIGDSLYFICSRTAQTPSAGAKVPNSG